MSQFFSPPDGAVKLTPKQANIYLWGWQPEARFRDAVCGRRFGKTFLAKAEMRRAARLAAKWNVSVEDEIWYAAPTFKQAMLGIVIDQMVVSIFGVDLICSFEGKRLTAYDDGVGVWTIGFGTTVYPNGIRVKKGDICTEAQAKAYMVYDLKKFESAVNNAVTVPLSQNQFDALVSLAYNIGTGAFSQSTLVKKLNAKDTQGAADQFDVWVNAGGKRMQGLVNRRTKEKLLFLS